MPFLDCKQQTLPYSENLTKIFATTCIDKPNTLLLESVEIESRNSLMSLLFANTAIKITCEGQRVSFDALNLNGKSLLPFIYQALSEKAQSINLSDNHDLLTAQFSSPDITLDEDSKLKVPTVFDGLRVIQNLFPTDIVYAGGLFAYDLVSNFIPMNNIELEDDGIDCPDYCFYLADQVIISNHETQQCTLHSFYFSQDDSVITEVSNQKENIVNLLNNPLEDLAIQSASTQLTENYDDEAFINILDRLKKHIIDGEVFQIVPSRRFSLACPNPLLAYDQLKKNNPSPYMFYMQDSDFTLFGASPESSLKYTADNRQLEVYPIAGSRPRGLDDEGNIDNELDARMELDLRLDKKELAEHLMLVDLARNDIARVCETGTRTVDKLMQVDRYSHIMHLVSRVTGTLKAEYDVLHAYQACMNMGTLTGAPKIRAMQLIYETEKQKRHSYGGAVGYFTSNGNFDTCIVIRSAFVQKGIAHIQAGCGQVLDSHPQSEADETRHKAAAVIKSIQQSHAAAQTHKTTKTSQEVR